MKEKKNAIVLIILVIAIVIVASIIVLRVTNADTFNFLVNTAEEQGEDKIEEFGAKSALEKDDFTVEEMLEFAIQDEYLARQEYESIMEEYGEQRPFSNIILAEEQHIEMLKDVYETYDYDIPEDTAIEHVVLPESILEALEIGVQAEIDNIAMYEKFLEFDLPDDVRDAFIKLRDASKKHLQAFQNGVNRGK